MSEKNGSYNMQTAESEDKEYYKEYYEKKKKEISVARKLRYQTDPVHREKLKKKSRERYRKKLKSPDKKLGYTIKHINGRPVFSIKYVLAVINKGRDFLETWEARGDIPRSTYVDKRGWRLYTQNQIDLLDFAIGQYDEKVWGREEVRNYLHSSWGD
jgi:hypothetical protein